MKHISILVLEGATVTSLDGTLQLFSRVNDFLKYQGKQAYYQVELISDDESTSLNNGTYSVNAAETLSRVRKTDLIIIPIICGNFDELNKANEKFTGWILDKYKRGSEIASLCVGSFYLASTGLLDGKQCATHWASKYEFKSMFPAVHVLDDTIITDECGIYTSGGTYSYLNLLLHIIEKHLGREMSLLTSKMFEIDIERKSQNQFAIFLGQKKHGDTEVLAAQEYIEKNTETKPSVDDLCERVGLSRRTFERRFKKSTGNSIVEYIQRVKVERAKKLLELGRKTINEIVYEVGYTDINAFRGVFRKYVGMSPLDYRHKFGASHQVGYSGKVAER